MPGIYTSQAELLKAGDHLVGRIAANAADLAFLDPTRTKLEGALLRIRECRDQQSSFRASKQESSKQIEALVRSGARLITVLRKAIAEHYGIENEKLIEFELQPFRGRARPTVPPEPEVPPPPPVIE